MLVVEIWYDWFFSSKFSVLKCTLKEKFFDLNILEGIYANV